MNENPYYKQVRIKRGEQYWKANEELFKEARKQCKTTFKTDLTEDIGPINNEL